MKPLSAAGYPGMPARVAFASAAAVLALALSACAFAFTLPESDLEPFRRQAALDESIRASIRLAADTREKTELAAKGGTLWKEELARIREELASKLPPEGRERLSGMHSAWEIFAGKALELHYALTWDAYNRLDGAGQLLADHEILKLDWYRAAAMDSCSFYIEWVSGCPEYPDFYPDEPSEDHWAARQQLGALFDAVADAGYGEKVRPVQEAWSASLDVWVAWHAWLYGEDGRGFEAHLGLASANALLPFLESLAKLASSADPFSN